MMHKKMFIIKYYLFYFFVFVNKMFIQIFVQLQDLLQVVECMHFYVCHVLLEILRNIFEYNLTHILVLYVHTHTYILILYRIFILLQSKGRRGKKHQEFPTCREKCLRSVIDLNLTRRPTRQ